MQYRIHPKTKDRISVIGIGTSSIYEVAEEEAVKALRKAYEGGINYFDLAAGHASAFPLFRKALSDVREQVFYQIHFGADYSQGEYGWTLELDQVKHALKDMLEALGTDYIDYGFIHCQDEVEDWETYQKNGVLDYLLSLKEQGIVHHIGLSSHTPSVIQKIMDEVDIDTLMFSINPAYDYGEGEFANGSVHEREAVYQRCEREGVAISVMKPFSGGQLLDASVSPFGKALSIHQCIRYALDKPGVLTVLCGAQSTAQVEDLLSFDQKSEEELDYSLISSLTPKEALGKCVYCNHCRPCPAGLDIGLINKYYDLSLAGDIMAKEHYKNLSRHASDCLHCGHCNKRCPFGVSQSEHMAEIAEYFGV